MTWVWLELNLTYKSNSGTYFHQIFGADTIFLYVVTTTSNVYGSNLTMLLFIIRPTSYDPIKMKPNTFICGTSIKWHAVDSVRSFTTTKPSNQALLVTGFLREWLFNAASKFSMFDGGWIAEKSSIGTCFKNHNEIHKDAKSRLDQFALYSLIGIGIRRLCVATLDFKHISI